MSEERVTKVCCDCLMDPATSVQGRCEGCQRDWNIRLARKLARTPKQGKAVSAK
jgi:hypothetical protein